MSSFLKNQSLMTSTIPIEERPARIKEQLERIEALMQEIDVHSSERPDAAAFNSTVPFCYDTMSFLEWLQWVMFPKTCELIDRQLPLPTVCEIHSLAEEEFKLLEQDTEALLAEILILDQLFSVSH